MRRSARSGTGGAGDAARGRIAGGGREFFGFGRGAAESAPPYLREECADSGRGRRRTGSLRAEHAADGALHEELSAAGVCDAPVRIAGRGCGDEEIGGSGINESSAGTVAVVAAKAARVISISSGRGTHERNQRAISICFGTG